MIFNNAHALRMRNPITHFNAFERMKYLVCYTGNKDAFFTNWFDAENHFVDGMVVFNVHQYVYTTDGTTWLPIKEDML